MLRRHEPTVSGRQRRQSPLEAKVERELDIVAVCMVCYRERVPRSFGDNEGVWPVKFVVTKDHREAHKIAAYESPVHKVDTRHYVLVQGKLSGRHLKTKLDELLLGQSEVSKLRHAWRDVVDPDMVWDILLGEALRVLRLVGFDEDEKQRRIKRVVTRRVNGFRRRG